MMTQSVMTQAANLLDTTTGNVTYKGKSKENDFSQLMNSSLKTSKDNSVSTDKLVAKKTSVQAKANSKQDRTKSDSTDSSDAKTDSVRKNQTAKTDSTKVTSQKDKDSTPDNAKVTKDEKEDNTQMDQTPSQDQQMLAQIQGVLEQIQQAVMDKLNLTSEELNQMLADQGLGLTDLLQPENLQQLVLANSGQTDIMSALTDENLAETMKQLLQNLDEIKSDNDLGLTVDQMKALLEQAASNTSEVTDTSNLAEQTQNKAGTLNQSEMAATQSDTDNKDASVTSTTSVTNAVSETSSTETVAKADTGSQANTDKDSNSDLNNSDKFQTFVDNLVKVSQNVKADLNSNVTQVTNIREIANQIIDHIKVTVTSDNTSMELQLNPESLGKVNLSIHSKEGVITAHFVVQNELSKEAIESQMQTLRETLDQQGVKVEAIEVTVSANAFEQNNFNGSENQADTKESKSGKHISIDDAISMTEVAEEEGSSEDITGVRGSLVDYTA